MLKTFAALGICAAIAFAPLAALAQTDATAPAAPRRRSRRLRRDGAGEGLDEEGQEAPRST